MTPVSLVAVGDVSFGDNGVCASFGVDSMLRKQPGLDMFEHVKGLLRGQDIVFGNLETVLSDQELDPTKLRSKHMRGRPVYVKQLVDAGFNVLNVANNHILQHGQRPFEETLDLLRSNGIRPLGLAGRGGAHCEPVRMDVRGTEIVFLGYAFETDKYYRGVPLYAQTGLPGIVSDIRRVKTSDNVVICSFHWGLEFITYPNFEQITVGRQAIDAGCDLVLGHHPHVLNGFERHNGKFVFYSLGNFVFDQLWNEDCRRSMAIHMRLAPGALELTSADGVRIGDDYRPVPLADRTFDASLARMCSDIQDSAAREGAGHADEASRKRSSNRYRSWLYLLTHLHRYDPVILKQILAEAVFRRGRSSRTRQATAGRASRS